MTMIDLEQLTRGEVFMLTGAPRGVEARQMFHLDEVEQTSGTIQITAPADLDTVTPSFVQGFLARSIQNLGAERFNSLFDLSLLPDYLAQDFRVGIERLLLRAGGKGHSILTA